LRYSLKMKSFHSGGPRQPPVLPRLKLRPRTRTCSTDSGCEPGSESPCDLLEDTFTSWTGRLEGVLGQEVARARELTSWAKEALRQHETGDDEKKEEIMEIWRREMEGVMEFTMDLVECVNNDTKEAIAEALGSCSSPTEASETIEEKEEDEENEEEIMKLFWTPCIFPTSKDIPKSLKKSQKRSLKTEKEKGQELNRKTHTPNTKQRIKNLTKDNKGSVQIYQGLKMLKSTLDAEDILDDWNWNLWEYEECEDIFADWLWNLEFKQDIRQKFYDHPDTKKIYNDFYFWNLNKPSLTHDMALGVLVNDDIEACISPDSGCFSIQMEEQRKKDNSDKWMNCKYWEETFQNENILHSLLEDEVQETDKTPVLTVNFWDESANNQASAQLQMSKEKKKREKQDKKLREEIEYLWENKDIIFALVPEEPKPQSSQYFPWEDPDTICGLMEDDSLKVTTRRTSGDSTFLWDDPAAIGMLLTDEEDEAYLPWDDKTDMTEEQLPSTLEEADVSPPPWEWLDKRSIQSLKEDEPVHTTWEEWSFWDQFGSKEEIIGASVKSAEHKLSSKVKRQPKERGHKNWEYWPFWDQFGTIEEIIKVNEELEIYRPSKSMKKIPQFNIQEAFWNITMAEDNRASHRLSQETQNLPVWLSPDVYADAWDHDTPTPSARKSGNQHKDPVNTFKAYRYIFYETDNNYVKKIAKPKDKTVLNDYLDIYSDWAPNVLADDRVEKKRQRRGRGRAKAHHRAPLTPQYSAGGTAVRPGTPTITVKKVKSPWDFESSWIESKAPKKERKTSQVWKAARNRRQLQTKIYAKQPRSCNAVFRA